MIARFLAFVARVISGVGQGTGSTLFVQGDPQMVFYANHGSHLDFMVIWSALPPAWRERTRPVAGGDYWGKGPLRRFLSRRIFNAILIERSPGSSVAHATESIDRIAEGMGDRHHLIVFPEGTRSLTGELLPFKSGMYHLAVRKPTLLFVPVYLANMNRILPKGEVLPVPMVGGVSLGLPIQLQQGEDKHSFLTRAREALIAVRDRQ
jgi:1-acyl-sn-glycerol-3-phosphate acyltransferase